MSLPRVSDWPARGKWPAVRTSGSLQDNGRRANNAQRKMLSRVLNAARVTVVAIGPGLIIFADLR